MAREDPQFKLRMPEDLHARIVEAAEQSGRSMNAEVVQRLESTFVADAYVAMPLFSRAKPTAAKSTGTDQRAVVAHGINQLVELSEFAAAVERFNSLAPKRARTADEKKALDRIIERWGDPPTWERGRSA